MASPAVSGSLFSLLQDKLTSTQLAISQSEASSANS